MFEVRIHGRGGQGVVTAAELLAVAAFLDGRFAQAFPSFGSERTGAPVVSYCRLDDAPIRVHDPVVDVDALVLQDATLLHEPDLFAGVHQDTFVLINSTRSASVLGLRDLVPQLRPQRLATVAATAMALRVLGRPLPNAILLGALVALCGIVPIDALEEAIRRRFPDRVAQANVAAAREAAGLISHREANMPEERHA